ncbi:DUF302 domain-containing protein [Marinobacterium sedimentorum]|uniref:DUF302 domain-containing protein n=1 Tax=Marinobacterium sedimentorum TaxID=2927804 RepID=UPI0020C746F5|nr:DUF302 domain-containing protein [Marinobacterium sedimentorum]MCP8687650.1 DUF302 domain-containing protein [Marinobacterium sedimentorum]
MTRTLFSLFNLQRSLRLAAVWMILSLPSLQAQAADEVRRIDSAQSFAQLHERLAAAVVANKMLVVTQASASQGAASRGVSIPGNLVVGVYRNDYAVRMLDASIAAGIEAPLRFYLTENADGSTSLSWATPSSTFAPYASPALDEMARELDDVFAAIARDATE